MTGAAELLAVWESGLPATGPRRALLLHALARGPGHDTETLLATPVGRRDGDLLRLRRGLFGDRLTGRLTCARCGEELEFDVDTTQLLDAVTDPPPTITVTHGGRRITARPPTAGDLVALASIPAARARAALLSRCIGGTYEPSDIPDDLADAVVAALAEADPGGDLRFTVPCVGCGATCTAPLDIGGYLWAELDAWARATLLDVHLLATAYGWGEAEILAISPTRRRYYLELSGHA
ncbi:hypothetical protein [Catenuloplanes atrovinosus]|uniref:Phage baseplate protein n=1 Tax=Catenuloplanes atrovinosus TaxID=137266 RepID=A0AAE3YL68_9ACTN|nr:hypothetical protein [Catenuloplanes atrovinosus]MDR7275510.1 hypothetical protein [Catenuloplanes atrovinosus]